MGLVSVAGQSEIVALSLREFYRPYIIIQVVFPSSYYEFILLLTLVEEQRSLNMVASASATQSQSTKVSCNLWSSRRRAE